MYTTRIKYYPNSTTGELIPVQIMCFNAPIFGGGTPRTEGARCSTAEGQTESDIIDDVTDGTAEGCTFCDTDDSHHTDVKYYKKVRRTCYDLIACNPQLTLFVTLTFDASVIDRYNYQDIIRKLNVWLDNRVRRHNLSYLLVPEFHKDGAIHFHGVMSQTALKLTNSGKRHRNKTIYNITDFPYGFTTAKRIGGKNHDIQAVAGYVTKYMTKALRDYEKGIVNNIKVGGRYYLSGGKLNRPVYKYTSINYPTEGGYIVNVDGLSLQGRIYTPAEDLTTQLTFSSLLKECQNVGLSE